MSFLKFFHFKSLKLITDNELRRIWQAINLKQDNETPFSTNQISRNPRINAQQPEMKFAWPGQLYPGGTVNHVNCQLAEDNATWGQYVTPPDTPIRFVYMY